MINFEEDSSGQLTGSMSEVISSGLKHSILTFIAHIKTSLIYYPDLLEAPLFNNIFILHQNMPYIFLFRLLGLLVSVEN